MGKVAVEGHEMTPLVEARFYAQVFQAIVLLRQTETVEADHADGIVDAGSFQVKLRMGRYLGVGYLEPACQLVGGVCGVKTDVRVGHSVVFHLVDAALRSNMLV